jgi:ABC-type sugar transport system ATPase subunit
MITLEGISKTYASKDNLTCALRSVSLEIRTGEMVALLGPSGCGKTTTLMTIAGFLRPDEGRILFDGVPVNDLPPKDRNIGMVFQSYALYPHLSVIDNIAFPLKYKGVDKASRYEQARAVARTVQIEELLHRKPEQLSGGQQQRVAMARALVKKPVVLLLDEPMSNLDARLKLDVRDEMRTLQKQIGITTIVVTHDQEEAMALADRIAVLDKGIIQQYDTPEALYGRPANLFVANFLGNPPMNIIAGTLEREEAVTFFTGAGMRHACAPDPARDARSAGCAVKLGIRPDDIRVVPAPTPRSIALTVELVEHMGGKRLVKARCTAAAGGSARTGASGAALRVLVPGGRGEIRTGDALHVELGEGCVHLFDPEEGGARIGA